MYFAHLRSRRLGRLLLHTPCISSSFDPLFASDKTVHDGLAVIPDIQVSGLGRGGNAWVSPEGCAMFSIAFKEPRRSELGSNPSILCQIVALSIVQEGVDMRVERVEKSRMRSLWDSH